MNHASDQSNRASRPLAAAAVILAVLFVGSGCQLQNTADNSKGRMLFTAKCGSCHTLAEAGTAGTNGPNLDAAFSQARADGEGADTIRGVVSAQIENPRRADPQDINLYMPPELVTGQDAEDVASYVASVAGVPGIKPPLLSPPDLFAASCGSCHTLAAAGTNGTIGPNLDKNLPGMSAAEIKESIVNPSAKITPGFQDGIMPNNFAQVIPPAQLNALVAFLVQNAGKK